MKIDEDNKDEITEAWGQDKRDIDTTCRKNGVGTTLENCEYMRSMRPLIVSMKIFGLYHSTVFYPSHNASDANEPSGKKSRIRSLSPSKVYSLVVSALLFLNACRMLTMFRKDLELGPSLYMRIMITAWVIACAAQAFFCYLAFGRPERFCAMLKSYNKLPLEELNISTCWKYIKRRVIIYTVAAWICFVFNTAYHGYEIFIHKSQDAIMLTPYEPNETSKIYDVIIRVLVFIVYIYLSAAWLFPSMFYFSICVGIWLQFKRFNNVLQRAIAIGNNINETLEELRQCHLKLCACVEHVSNMFSAYNALNIIVSTCNTILVLYVICWYTTDTFTRVVQAFWVISCVVTLGVVALGGGMLNEEAHGSLDALHNIKYCKADRLFEFSMNMFLSKLKASPIGLSVSGIFVIDKAFILTIAGILVTYFILLVQFKPSEDNTPNGLCNCTETICS